MAGIMYTVSFIFDTVAGQTLNRKDFPVAKLLADVQVNNQPALMNATKQNIGVLWTMLLQVRIRDYRVRVDLGAIGS